MRARHAALRFLAWLGLALLLTVGALFLSRHRREHRYDGLIAAAAARHGVDPALVSAVIWRESRFQPAIRGKAGEYGLMQVREPAAREWARACGVAGFRPDDLLDPRTNIEAGTWYLGRALKRWRDRDDPVPFALAEYNAGPTHARRWAAMPGAETAAGFRDAITFPTTRAYISNVLSRSRSAH